MIFLDEPLFKSHSLQVLTENGSDENTQKHILAVLDLQKKYDIMKKSIPYYHRCCICSCYTDKRKVCIPCGHTQYCDKCIDEIQNCRLCEKDIISVIKTLS